MEGFEGGYDAGLERVERQADVNSKKTPVDLRQKNKEIIEDTAAIIIEGRRSTGRLPKGPLVGVKIDPETGDVDTSHSLVIKGTPKVESGVK